MAYQLIYTSVRSGLVAGRSGFCTAARHREIKESLVARLEDFASSYDRSLVPEGDSSGKLPVFYSYRIVTIRESRHHVLMRIGDAGNDYSGRTNHIAHAIVLSPEEMATLRITPAEAILALAANDVWRTRYEEPAQFFGPAAEVDLSRFALTARLPASNWGRETGSPANAAHLLGRSGPVEAGLEVTGAGDEESLRLLRLFAESLLLLDPHRTDPATLWSVPFTSLLQSRAEARQFTWGGCLAGSALAESERSGGRLVLRVAPDLTPPEGREAVIAGTGEIPPEEPSSKDDSATAAEESHVESIARGEEAASETPTQANAEAIPESGGASLPPIPDDGIALPSASLDSHGRDRRAGSTKGKLAVAAAAVLLALIAIGAFWVSRKDVWAAEKTIRPLVEKGRWNEIGRRLDGPDFEQETTRSGYLESAKQAAKAIVRYRGLARNPTNHAADTVVVGSDSPEDALEIIKKEWAEAPEASREEYGDRVEAEREKAQRAVEELENAENALEKLWENLSSVDLEAPSPDAPSELEDFIGAAKEAVKELEAVSPQGAANGLRRQIKVLEDNARPGIKILVETRRKYDSEADLEQAKTEIAEKTKNWRSALNSFADDRENPKRRRDVAQQLSSALEGLPDDLVVKETKSDRPNEPDSKPKEEGDEKTQDKEKREESVFPTIYLLPMPEDGEFDLSGIPEIKAKIESDFRMIPLAVDVTTPDSEKDESKSDEIVELKFYRDDNLVRTRGGSRSPVFKVENRPVLGKTEDADIWDRFQSGFRFEFGSRQTPNDSTHIAFVPISEPKSEPNSNFLRKMDLPRVIKEKGGSFHLTEEVVRYLQDLETPGVENRTWKITLAAKDGLKPFSRKEREDGELGESFDPQKQIQKQLADLREKRNEIARANESINKAELLIGKLPEKLFPPKEKRDQMPRLKPDAKPGGPPYRAERADLEPLDAPSDSQIREKEAFVAYIRKHLLEVLDERADGSVIYNPIHHRIKRLREGNVESNDNGSSADWLSRFREFAELLKGEDEPGPGPAPDPRRLLNENGEHFTKTTNKEEPRFEAAVEDYNKQVAEIYARTFFEGWKEIFTKENVGLLEKYFKARAFLDEPESKNVDTEIKRLEKLQAAFRGDSFLESGEVRIILQYTEEIEKVGGPSDEKDPSIPVLRGIAKP